MPDVRKMLIRAVPFFTSISQVWCADIVCTFGMLGNLPDGVGMHARPGCHHLREGQGFDT